MQYHSESRISSYMTGPLTSGCSASSFIPALGIVQDSWKAYDSYPAPAPLRRCLTTIPWSPSVYYSTAKVNNHLASGKSPAERLIYGNHLSTQDNVKIPALFSTAKNALYTRYTPDSWTNHKKAISADQVRATGIRMRLEGARLANELDSKTKQATADVGKMLGDRIQDVNFWRIELTVEIDAMLNETAELNKAKAALQTFLKGSDNQLHVATECLYHREKRQGIDMVHDDAEKAMIGEVDLTRRCQQMARTHMNQASGQLDANRAAQHELEKDSKDKHIASSIDKMAFNLKDTSRGIALHSGVERIDNTVTTPESWADYTNSNIKRSQAERAASKNMRNDIQSTLNHASEQLWKQWDKVNAELSERIRETMDARNKIQHHLSGTLQEIFDTEKHIELMKKAIHENAVPLKVATTRLESRLHRPNMEACRDTAQSRLVQQVYQIDESIQSLNNQLRIIENQLQALLRKRSALEHDLAIKNNTLYIDQEKCLGIRRTYPMPDRVWKLV